MCCVCARFEKHAEKQFKTSFGLEIKRFKSFDAVPCVQENSVCVKHRCVPLLQQVPSRKNTQPYSCFKTTQPAALLIMRHRAITALRFFFCKLCKRVCVAAFWLNVLQAFVGNSRAKEFYLPNRSKPTAHPNGPLDICILKPGRPCATHRA